MLPYCGRTMLEGLMRDVQAREYLYFRLTGLQVGVGGSAIAPITLPLHHGCKDLSACSPSPNPVSVVCPDLTAPLSFPMTPVGVS